MRHQSMFFKYCQEVAISAFAIKGIPSFRGRQFTCVSATEPPRYLVLIIISVSIKKSLDSKLSLLKKSLLTTFGCPSTSQPGRANITLTNRLYILTNAVRIISSCVNARNNSITVTFFLENYGANARISSRCFRKSYFGAVGRAIAYTNNLIWNSGGFKCTGNL